MAYLDKVSISGTTYNVQDTSTQAGVSNVFSTTTAYSVGQYVWYDGDGTGAKLYRFTAAHAAGDWVGSDAVQVALADDVTDLKSAVDIIPMTSGGYINVIGETVDVTTIHAKAGYSYAVVNCSEGDVFTVNAEIQSGDTIRPFAFLGANGVMLVNTSYTKLDNAILIAPENAEKLVINDGGNLQSFIGYRAECKIDDLDIKKPAVHWENGGISSINGLNNGSTNKIRSQFIPVAQGDELVFDFDSSVDRLYVFRYIDSVPADFAGYEQITSSGKYTVAAGTQYVRFTYGPSASGTIDVSYGKRLIVTTPQYFSGLESLIGIVRYDKEQNLTDSQQQTGRSNLGTPSSNEFMASTGNKEITFTTGGYIPCAMSTGIDITTPTANTSYRYAVVPCTVGDLFTISATGGTSGRAWAWIDLNGNLIANAIANKTVENKLMTAPENAAYLIINDTNTGVSSYVGNLARVVSNAIVDATKTIPLVWEVGGLASSNGSENILTNRIRTQFVSVTPGDVIVFGFDSGTRLYVFKFTDSEVHAFTGYDEITEPGNYIVPTGCNWIRLTIGPRVSEAITTAYSKNLFVGTTDTAESVYVTDVAGEEISLTFTSGKYQMWNGLYTTIGDWGYSDNITVVPGDYLRVVNAWAADYRPIFFFDGDGMCLSTYDTTKNAKITEFLIRVPTGASYCVLNTKYSERANTKLYRIRSKIELHDISATSASETASRTGHKLTKIFDKIKAVGPLFTLVDDDGRNLTQVSEFHRICSQNGIIGCNALATKFIEDMTSEDRETFLTTVKGYENEGFENVLHCYNHDYWESSIKAASMTDDEIYAAVTNDLVTGMRQMRDLGFINWEHWIVPQGKTELPNVQKVARNLGFRAIYDVADNTFNRFVPRDDLFHRYNIPRMELYPTDDANPPLTLQLIKDQALQCKEEGGWLIVCTHFYQAGWATSDPTFSRVSEMIQYIMGLGFTNVTLSGGLSYWEDIYRLYGLY